MIITIINKNNNNDDNYDVYDYDNMVTGTKDAKVSDRPLEMPNADNVLME